MSLPAPQLQTLVHEADRQGQLKARVPVTGRILDGRLVSLLEDHVHESDQFSVLRPASRQVTSRLRAFIDFMTSRLTPE